MPQGEIYTLDMGSGKERVTGPSDAGSPAADLNLLGPDKATGTSLEGGSAKDTRNTASTSYPSLELLNV